VVRFESIKQALSDWISAQPSTTSSDFSITNNNGAVQSNLTNPQIGPKPCRITSQIFGQPSLA